MSSNLLIADTTPNQSEPVELSSRAVALESVVDPAADSHAADSPAGESKEQGSAGQVSTFANDLLQLTKPRIVTMILVTTVMTAFIGAGGLVGIVDMFWLLIGTAMVAGSSGAANQIWERVIDCNMTRTASRPLPAGRISIWTAVIFTAAIGIAGSLLLNQMFGFVPAMSAVATWLIYVLVYTPMKTRTAWNTTVGAIAGALPVLIGYTATGGLLTDWTGWLLFGVLVTWQYPHFMSIAWMYRKQYDEAGFKMTTTVEPTGRSAAWQSVIGSLALIVCGIALAWIPGGLVVPIVASIGVFASCYPMLKASLRFKADPNDQTARKMLRSSLLVLPAVLLIVTLRVFL